jgi:predicted metal-binding membrane protein
MIGAAQRMAQRDRVIVIGCIFATVALAWSYLAVSVFEMSDKATMANAATSAMADVRAAPWSAADFLTALSMWAVMMIGMMLPTAIPMALMFVRVNRKRRRDDDAFVPTGVFVAGYVAIWSVFSLVMTFLQWGLEEFGMFSSMVGKINVLFGGLVLVAVGIYQWTPLKDACLRLCQTPLGFFMTRWREGTGGVFRMGLSHGAYCIGCCWALMLLMFVGGVMNLLWMALLTALVLTEKIAPPGSWLPRTFGTVLIGWGSSVVASNF